MADEMKTTEQATEAKEKKTSKVKAIAAKTWSKVKKPVAGIALIGAGFGLDELCHHIKAKKSGSVSVQPETYMSIDQDGNMDQIQ